MGRTKGPQCARETGTFINISRFRSSRILIQPTMLKNVPLELGPWPRCDVQQTSGDMNQIPAMYVHVHVYVYVYIYI